MSKPTIEEINEALSGADLIDFLTTISAKPSKGMCRESQSAAIRTIVAALADAYAENDRWETDWDQLLAELKPLRELLDGVVSECLSCLEDEPDCIYCRTKMEHLRNQGLVSPKDGDKSDAA